MNDYAQDDECRHGMPAPEQCSRCMDERRKAQQRQETLTGFGPRLKGIVAEYAGHCPRCGDTITPGERITRSEERYIHVRCF